MSFLTSGRVGLTVLLSTTQAACLKSTAINHFSGRMRAVRSLHNDLKHAEGAAASNPYLVFSQMVPPIRLCYERAFDDARVLRTAASSKRISRRLIVP